MAAIENGGRRSMGENSANPQRDVLSSLLELGLAQVSSSGLSRGSIAQHTPHLWSVRAMRSYWTYILASKQRGTLYIGVTNGLIFRVEQHRAGQGSAFTRKYRIHTLVWYEEFADIRDAI